MPFDGDKAMRISRQLKQAGIRDDLETHITHEIGWGRLSVNSAEDLANISDKVLLKIKGVGPKTVEKIRRHFGGPPKKT